jgi:hypothetical protein
MQQSLVKRSTLALALAFSSYAGAAFAADNIGGKMPDGTVYAGVSPDTGKAMYAAPADASLAMEFNEAHKYCAELDASGHRDWRVPKKTELNMLFNNRAAVGGFNVSGSLPESWYWSASSHKWHAWAQRFTDGYQSNDGKGLNSSVRCVR